MLSSRVRYIGLAISQNDALFPPLVQLVKHISIAESINVVFGFMGFCLVLFRRRLKPSPYRFEYGNGFQEIKYKGEPHQAAGAAAATGAATGATVAPVDGAISCPAAMRSACAPATTMDSAPLAIVMPAASPCDTTVARIAEKDVPVAAPSNAALAMPTRSVRPFALMYDHAEVPMASTS